MDKFLLAFLLVVGAGLSTGIGAAVVYNSRLVVLASKEVLGLSLGLSAGVMLYVSFVEIFQKSVSAFNEVGLDFGMAYFWATFCFFAGIVCIRLIDKVVHYLAPIDLHLLAVDLNKVPAQLREDDISGLQQKNGKKDVDTIALEEGKFGEKDDGKRRAPDQETAESSNGATFSAKDSLLTSTDGDVEVPAAAASAGAADGADDQSIVEEDKDDTDKREERGAKKSDCKHGAMELTEEHVSLKRMGLFTALAIAIHNFPEGLATFVATLDDPTVGIALAVAIAIHNIPEGLCVAMPIYFATGNRHVAFGWGVLSGMSEILAAGLGWAILANTVDGNAYGILFGLVAGMMVAICMYELLPTARKYDSDDHFVTHSVIAGMLLMSVSLVVFQF